MSESTIDLSDLVPDGVAPHESSEGTYALPEPPPPAPVPGGFVQDVSVPATLFSSGDDQPQIALERWGYCGFGVYVESDELDAFIPFSKIDLIQFHYPESVQEEVKAEESEAEDAGSGS